MESPFSILHDEVAGQVDTFLSEVHTPIVEHIEKGMATTGMRTIEAASLILILRTYGWCRANKLLLAEGHWEETYPVFRSIIERLIVAYEWSSTHCSTDAVRLPEVDPPKHVARFKAFLPTVGLLYNRLSQVAHFSPQAFRQSISLHDGHELRVNLTTSAQSNPAEIISASIYLYWTIDLCASLADWIIARTKDKTEHWIRSNETSIPTNQCKHQIQIIDWSHRLDVLLDRRLTEFI